MAAVAGGWEWVSDPERVETRSVDMQLMRLRRKLDGVNIETVRGEGYRYTG